MGDRSQPRRNPAGRAFVNHTTRREFLKDAALAGAAVSTFSLAEGSLLSAAGQGNSIDDSSIARKNAVQLAWVGAQPPAMPTGISWGVPFAQGAVRPNTTFALNAAGAALPLQSWPMAYWPDGSLKWSGFATVAPAGLAANSRSPPAPRSPPHRARIKVTNNPNIGRCGYRRDAVLHATQRPPPHRIIHRLHGGMTIAGACELVCILQNGPAGNPEDSPARENDSSASVKKVTVEQSGPVRAVVKIEGMHRGDYHQARVAALHRAPLLLLAARPTSASSTPSSSTATRRRTSCAASACRSTSPCAISR